MTESTVGKGSCLCGAVHITVKKMNPSVGACHCEMCRKWAGGPLMSVFCGTDVTFEGEEFIRTFDSSSWAERGFCEKCGSGLFYKLKENQQYHIPFGLFEKGADLTFDHQVFIDKKPECYSFSNKTKDMTEAEVFAMYGASES